MDFGTDLPQTRARKDLDTIQAHATGGSGGRSPPAAGGHGREHLFLPGVQIPGCSFRGYRFCMSWLRSPGATQGGLHPIP